MDRKEIEAMRDAYLQVQEKKTLDPVGQADADIDNDGDVDKSDKYLHNRRKVIRKAMKKEGCGKMRKEEKVQCPKCEGKGCSHCGDTGYHMKEGKWNYPKDMTSKTNKEDDDYLGGLISSRKKEARKAHRKAMKAKAHKELMRGTRKEDVEHVQEAKKKIHSVSNGKNRADVIKLTGMDDEGDPYIVKLFKNGKHYEPADYYTDDKKDAIGTAKMMVKEDVEQIDELKKSTLASYIKKAQRSGRASSELSKKFDNDSYRPLAKMNRHHPNITGYRNKKGQEKKKSPKKYDKAKSEYDTLQKLSKTFGDQAKRRQQGIDRAADKLAREGVEYLDEGIINDIKDLFKAVVGDGKRYYSDLKINSIKPDKPEMLKAIKSAMDAHPEFEDIVRNGTQGGRWKSGYKKKFDDYMDKNFTADHAKRLGFVKADRVKSKIPLGGAKWVVVGHTNNAKKGIASVVKTGMKKEETELLSAIASMFDLHEVSAQTKGATKPEELLSKESQKSKQFVDAHKKSDKKWEDLEDKGHDDVTKAGRAVKSRAPARRADQMDNRDAMQTPDDITQKGQGTQK